ncbi:hypothetical protein [Brevibacillus brevis]|uniref:hypothetical protein n=1 Tax=Brevibacillus brevis TaxID=1393 RepID=UPI00165E1943|nr:hypothetical protein [Brevibacillus brevis]
MTEYKSRFLELGFYVNDIRFQFQNGRFVTDDPEVISVLNTLVDVERVGQTVESEKPEPKTEEPEAPAKSARKPSAK